MKPALLFLIFGANALFAEITDQNRVEILKITGGNVKETVDDFEKITLAEFTGPALEFNDGIECTASATWMNGDIQQVSFHLLFSRVNESWHWMDSNDAKILVDGERVHFEQSRLRSKVLDSGRVYEGKSIVLTLEQALQIIAAEETRVKVGPDDYVFAEKERGPLQLVLYYWIGKGGDLTGYKELVARIARPSVGKAFGDVVKKHGPPVWRDPETGWATWESFWVRFKDGKVVETRPRNTKKKAAH